jgi:hypothetical protein
MGKNLVWFGEIERKFVKLSMTPFAYRSSSQLFYAFDNLEFLFSKYYSLIQFLGDRLWNGSENIMQLLTNSL